ncbi:MAG: hypothetical protein ACRC3Y_05565 [Romboutsia sp.]|uniref:hypothetical protein n=1 Tax=Romboutsia sp. TaxID=1965302 RepID=UPI003F2C3516
MNINNINTKYSTIFKEYNISHVVSIPSPKPTVKKILESVAHPEVINIKVTDTINRTSNEGQELSGNKLLVDFSIKGRLIYTSYGESGYVHIHNFDTLKSLAITLPKNIDSSNSQGLFKSGRLQVNPYIENVHTRKIDEQNVYTSILLFLDVKEV